MSTGFPLVTLWKRPLARLATWRAYTSCSLMSPLAAPWRSSSLGRSASSSAKLDLRAERGGQRVSWWQQRTGRGVSHQHQMCLWSRPWANLVHSPGLRCCRPHSATLNAGAWSGWTPPAGLPLHVPLLCKVLCEGLTLWHKICVEDHKPGYKITKTVDEFCKSLGALCVKLWSTRSIFN